MAASFLNPDWFTKLARPILLPERLSRQPKSLLSFLFYAVHPSFLKLHTYLLTYRANTRGPGGLKNSISIQNDLLQRSAQDSHDTGQ